MTEASKPIGPDLTGDPAAPAVFNDDLKPGSLLLDGHYQIKGFLNAGGFGITYLARDTIDRTVVVKECFPNTVCHRVGEMVTPRSRKHAAAFRAFVQAFIEEARNLSKVVHPNIVGVHQVFEDNGTAYMVIDYIEGRDLQDILASTAHAFSPTEVITMLQRVLSAVEFIHQIGILHRDISPDNILIDKTGKPVLIDFGEASENLTPESRIVTARRVVKDGYSPQELYLTGAEQTEASDLYSLGATFYHVVTGKAPPPSQKRLAALANGEADPMVPLAGRFAGYPPGALESIDAALRVFQKDRLQSALDWITRLGDSSGTAAMPTSGASRPPARRAPAAKSRPARDAGFPADRRRILLGSAALVFVLALGVWWASRA